MTDQRFTHIDEGGLSDTLADLADKIDAARERHIGEYPRDLDTTLQGIADRLRTLANDGDQVITHVDKVAP